MLEGTQSGKMLESPNGRNFFFFFGFVVVVKESLEISTTTHEESESGYVSLVA